ncbi:hypothetical protein I4F81_003595 [Pyropia yezoensis]|uniref:Uncharacterized protein n=1 Tax=Pyropia yezoensis TaxID=2788 RepID=A0ACC3BTG9_PYRYE|nr:hypothetical protein I4F81_003595 [Neopyropia yezoensis]
MATPLGPSDHNATMGDGRGPVSLSAPSSPRGPSATRMPPAAPGDVLMDDAGSGRGDAGPASPAEVPVLPLADSGGLAPFLLHCRFGATTRHPKGDLQTRRQSS